jgi:phosphoglycolate phosphatase
MMRRLDLVVFDWDGTLMDSPAAIVAAISGACLDLGIEPPSEELARHVIGLGLQDALSTALPQLAPADYPRLADRYRHHYLAKDHELTLFEGARALLAELEEAGLFLGVATGKTRAGLDRALASTGLAGRFHATRCADECFSKPHPAMLLEILDSLGVDAERAVMVGDTTHDLLMARSAGVASVGVAFGAHPRAQLAAEASLGCVADIEELRQCLLALV